VLIDNDGWFGGFYSATPYVSIGAFSEAGYPGCRTESIAPKEAGSPRIFIAEVPRFLFRKKQQHTRLSLGFSQAGVFFLKPNVYGLDVSPDR
jgi:hypothetical protein